MVLSMSKIRSPSSNGITTSGCSIDKVPDSRLELEKDYSRGILSPLRLPISPVGHGILGVGAEVASPRS
jgi:hypothetical protein